jgi:hypothetical protein
VLEDAPRTVYALTQTLFPDLSAMDCFLAISEVLAHLEWLEHEGVVSSHMQNGLVLWQRKT